MFAIFTTPHPVCKGISQSYDWISQQSTRHRCMRHVQQEIKTNRPIQNYEKSQDDPIVLLFDLHSLDAVPFYTQLTNRTEHTDRFSLLMNT